MNPYTYIENVANALLHIRQFLDHNQNESVTGHHDAYERLKHTEADPEIRALDNLLLKVLNLAHEYAQSQEE